MFAPERQAETIVPMVHAERKNLMLPPARALTFLAGLVMQHRNDGRAVRMVQLPPHPCRPTGTAFGDAGQLPESRPQSESRPSSSGGGGAHGVRAPLHRQG